MKGGRRESTVAEQLSILDSTYFLSSPPSPLQSIRRYNNIVLGLLKNKKKNAEMAIFLNFMRCVRKLRYYSDVIHSFDWKSAVEHDGKCVIVYLVEIFQHL